MSFHITGNHPTREIGPEDFKDYPLAWVVHFPSGHETLQIAVHGDGLTDNDAIDAATEFLEKRNYWKGQPTDEEGIRAVRYRG